MRSDSNREYRNSPTGFFAELKRRRVLQIGGAYIAGAWLGVEILTFLLDQFQAPDWVYRFVAIVFVVGFPLAVVLAWVVQIQADGTWALDSERGDHRTIAAAVVLGVFVTAGLSWLIVPDRPSDPVYKPLPNSLAVVPFEDGGVLYRSLMTSLERSGELTLVRLEPGYQPDDVFGSGENLGVEKMAVGRHLKTADQMQIDVELFDIAMREKTWSQSFDLTSAEEIEVSHEIASDLLGQMGVFVLSPDEFMGTSSGQAYLEFLAGNDRLTTETLQGLADAIDHFQRAIELDRSFVQGYVGLATSLYRLRDLSDPTDQERQALQDRASIAVTTAQSLDSRSADVMSLLGLGDLSPQLRAQAFERALELDPDHDISYYRYAVQMRDNGQLEEAERLLNRAIRLRPMSEKYRAELARIREMRTAEES